MAGLAAAAVALGVAELVAGAMRETSLVVVVGQYIIDHAPGGASRFAIDLFGENDKPALIVTIVAGSLVLGAAAGVIARRWFVPGSMVIGAQGVAGALAAAATPATAGATYAVVALGGGAAGVFVLRMLVNVLPPEPGVPGNPAPDRVDPGRRKFFRLSGGAAGLALGSAAGGRWLSRAPVDIAEERAAVTLPTPLPSQTPLPDPAQAALSLKGISSLVTPNAHFYRVDTALVIPAVDLESWRLKVTGLVDSPYELSYKELLDMEMKEQMATLACVSNEVGGHLAGNASWLGIPLRELLERAGIQPRGTQIIARSVDGFTTAFPTAVALDGRPSMVAVGMNGEVLPASYGFPARMIVPGLYGYVSATKWLQEIEVSTIEGFDAYWITRGWAKEGPIKTQSRIDLPISGATIAPGPVEFGGVAWAGARGISAVEVRIIDQARAREELGDGWIGAMGAGYGEWRPALLSRDLTPYSWRQWAIGWDAVPGKYRIEVRATDGLGETQTHRTKEPYPDGATGYHGFSLTVE